MPHELLDDLHLVQVGLAREKRFASDEFCEDAPDGPQVDGLVVIFVAQDNFWSSVPASHYIFG